jgi:hypothetical protein
MGLFDKLTGKDARIQVNFIHNATSESISVTELTPEQLPATFDVATTLTIREQQWSVQEAIPATAAEFTRTGSLTLRLNKIEHVNPEDILYTLPTISNELPDVEETARFQEFELSILADNWRQNEFLPASAAPRIAEEIAAIEDIWQHHSTPAGEGIQAFRQLHVRATIGEPGLALDLAQLKAVLGTERLGSLKFHDQPGYVRGGFALETATAQYYGILEGTTVTHLCLSRVQEEALPEVQAVNQAFDLVFVVWYQAQVVGPED